MLKLVVNNQNVDLGTNPIISLDEQSPVFDRKGLKGGHALPFTLPGTPGNNKIFGFPNRVERSEYPSKDFNFQLFHTGKLRAIGTISVKQTGDKSLQAYLKIGSGNFFSAIQDKKLADYNYGGLRTFVKKSEYTYPTDDFTLFPVQNSYFFQNTKYHDDFTTGLWRLNAWINNEFVTSGAYPFAICPFPFLNYVLKTIFTEHGFNIIESVFDSDKDLNSLVFYNNVDITNADLTYSVDTFNDTDGKGQVISVNFNKGFHDRTIDQFDLKNHLPDMLISDLIISLQNTFNLSFIFDNENNLRILKREKLIQKQSTKDLTDIVIGTPEIIIEKKPDGFKFTWEHDQNDEFTSSQYFPIDQHLDKFKYILDLNSELENLNPDPFDICYVKESDWYLQYYRVLDGSDYKFVWLQLTWGTKQNLVIDNGKEEIKSKFSTLYHLPEFSPEVGVDLKCPATLQEGNMIEKNEITEFSSRLLFYRGKQKDSNNDDYPMGSSDVWDYNWNKITDANLCLRWDGEYGLYEKCWKGFLYWWMNRKLTKWKVKDPSDIEFDKIYTIDRSKYILKKKSTAFSLHRIEPKVCEFYSV